MSRAEQREGQTAGVAAQTSIPSVEDRRRCAQSSFTAHSRGDEGGNKTVGTNNSLRKQQTFKPGVGKRFKWPATMGCKFAKEPEQEQMDESIEVPPHIMGYVKKKQKKTLYFYNQQEPGQSREAVSAAGSGHR